MTHKDDSTPGTSSVPRSMDQLELAVRHSEGAAVPVRLLHVSATECEYACTSAPAAAFPLGAVITLAFLASQDQERWELPATVVSRSEHPEGRRYGVRFVALVQLPLPLYALLTRRSGYRVRPGPKEAQSIRIGALQTDERPGYPLDQPAMLEDISVSGVGISLKPECEARFASSEHVRIEIDLPTRREKLRLAGQIRNRKLTGGRLFYGIEFDRDRSKSYVEQVQVIREYVAARVGEEVRRANEVDGKLGTFL